MEEVPIFSGGIVESEGESLSSFLSGELERLERELKELHEENKRQHDKIGEYKEKYEQLSHQHSIKVHLLEKHKADLKSLNVQLMEKNEEIARLTKRASEFENVEEELKERVENLKKRSFDKDMDNARLHNELKQCRESRTAGELILQQVNQHLEDFIGNLMTGNLQSSSNNDTTSNSNSEKSDSKASEIKKKLTLACKMTWGKVRTCQEQVAQKDKDFMEAMEELGGCLENIKLTYSTARDSKGESGEEETTGEDSDDSVGEGQTTPENIKNAAKDDVRNVSIFSDGKGNNSSSVNANPSAGIPQMTTSRNNRDCDPTVVPEARVLDHQGNWCYQCKFCNGLFFNHSVLRLHFLQKHPKEAKKSPSEPFSVEENIAASMAYQLENASFSGMTSTPIQELHAQSSKETTQYCNQCYNHEQSLIRGVSYHNNLIPVGFDHSQNSQNPVKCSKPAAGSSHKKRDSTQTPCGAHSPRKRKKTVQMCDQYGPQHYCARQRRWSGGELVTPTSSRRATSNKMHRVLKTTPKTRNIFSSHSVESVLDSNVRPSTRMDDEGRSADRQLPQRQASVLACSCSHSANIQEDINSTIGPTNNATQKNLSLKMVNVRVVLSPARAERLNGSHNLGKLQEKSSSGTTSVDEDDIIYDVDGV